MIFRAEEAAQAGFERALRYLTPRDATPQEKAEVAKAVQEMTQLYGPVIDTYPTWHPLVPQTDPRHPQTLPSEQGGYQGLDHNVYFVNAFVTCPYGHAEEVIGSAMNIQVPDRAGTIQAEELELPLYNKATTPVLIRIDWEVQLENGHQIPASRAIPLMLENEVPSWRWSDRSEDWEEMRHYLLGSPHGRRSSQFVSQATAIQIKKIYEAMNESGMYDR